MIVKAILEWDEDAQSYSATCPELNYISSCGDTKEEAVENLKDAIQLLLEPMNEKVKLSRSVTTSTRLQNRT